MLIENINNSNEYRVYSLSVQKTRIDLIPQLLYSLPLSGQ
jgi:hypothetical protein